MDIIARSFLLNQIQQKQQQLPVKYNGCIRFIPISNPRQNVRNQCILNCVNGRQQIDANVWAECAQCCDNCINSENGDISNCVSACGAPTQDILSRIDSAIIGNNTSHPSSNIGGPIVYQTVFTLANSFVGDIFCAYGNMLGQGDTLTLSLAHRREGSTSLDDAELFDILIIARSNDTLFVANPACDGTLSALSAAVISPGNPFIAQLFITLDHQNSISNILKEGPIHQFTPSNDIVTVPSQPNIFCNNNVSNLTSQNIPIPSC